jgi:membrane protein required for colicin V production
MNLAAFDWVVLAVLLLSMVLGAWRGLVVEVLSVLGWIAAFVL